MNKTLTLPWSPVGLSPNARLHWSKKAKLTKLYRHDCGWQAKAQGVRTTQAKKMAVHLTFVPPDRRAYDEDNLVSRSKALLDGLADALGVNDKCFKLTYDLESEPCPLGMVKVRLEVIE